MNAIRIRFRPDDEWVGELWVSASANGFSGTGEAWFDKEGLREFAHAITAFPLPEDTAPEITGGLGGNAKLAPQQLVMLKFEPHDAQGAVRATVHLETERKSGESLGPNSEATIRFLLTYGDLGRFGPAMLDLLDERIEEAVLTSSA